MKNFIIGVLFMSFFVKDNPIQTVVHEEIVHIAIPTPLDLHIAAKMVYGEARGEIKEGRLAVLNVASNRVRNILSEVINKKGQFDGMGDYEITTEGLTEAYIGICGTPVLPDDYLYFCNPEEATDSLFVSDIESSENIRIGNHVFSNLKNE